MQHYKFYFSGFLLPFYHKSYLQKISVHNNSYVDLQDFASGLHSIKRYHNDGTVHDGMDPPPHIPMPPPGRNDAPTPNASAPVVGARQNCPAAERQGIILTPPRAVELRRGTVGSERSAMSSLRTTTTDQLSTECAHAATALTDTTPLSGNKRPASVLHPDSSPSPSKNYPDYSITKSCVRRRFYSMGG